MKGWNTIANTPQSEHTQIANKRGTLKNDYVPHDELYLKSKTRMVPIYISNEY